MRAALTPTPETTPSLGIPFRENAPRPVTTLNPRADGRRPLSATTALTQVPRQPESARTKAPRPRRAADPSSGPPPGKVEAALGLK